MPTFKNLKLGELITLNYGKSLTAHTRVAGNIPVYSSSGITGSHNKALVESEAVIVGRKGTVGSVFYTSKPFYCIDTAYYVLPSANYDLKYIYYMLQTIGLDQLNEDSAVPGLNRETAYSQEVTMPTDHPTQSRIASILSALDDKIELNRQMNQTLEQMAQALFKKYFVDDIDPDNLPEGWRWGVLSDVSEFSNGYAFSSRELLDADTGSCYHVFKMGHIKKGGGLHADGTKSYFEKEKAKGIEKYILKRGDLLMCMTDMKGNVALLGHTALMNEDDKYIVNQRVGLIRTNNSVGIDYPYLFILTNSRSFIEDLRSRANSGVQVNLSTAEIKNTKIVIAPKKVNEEFNGLAKPLFDTIFQKTKENEYLIKIRDTLLPKLMSGEIEVNAPIENEVFS